MIVATLLEPRLQALQEAIAACDATADAFEIRLDALEESIDPVAIRALTGKPLVAAFRQPVDGGIRTIEPDVRSSLLRACADAGFEYVDQEASDAPQVEAHRIVRARHDQRGTPSAASLVRMAQETDPGSVFKFASRVRSFSDTLILLGAARDLQRQARPYAIMGLGEFPRALTHLMGARFVYGGGRTNASGQPSHADIAATLRLWGSPEPKTGLLLVVGDPVAQSLSPRMHNAALRHAGADLSYGALRIGGTTELQMLLERAGSLGLQGLSVTTPLKDAAFELCARRTPEAESARAVNCIQIVDGAAFGHNTDGLAAAQIARRMVGQDGRILLLGTGGAARALASRWPADRLTIAGRTPEALRRIGRERGCKAVPLAMAQEEFGEADLVVNATRDLNPVDLGPHKGALFDFHYGPQATAWEWYAKQRDLPFAGGLELLLAQGVLAFRVWTGQEPPVDVMQKALEVPA